MSNTCFKYSTFCLFALILSLSLRLLLSNPTLEYFYPYASEGGNAIQKIHPGTWLIFGAFVLAVLFKGVGRLLSKQKVVVYAFLATLGVISYSALRFGTSGAAYFIDTYLYTCICLFLVTSLRYSQVNFVQKFLIFFAIINALVAGYEYIFNAPMMPNALDFGFFRAHALLGHPLNNGLIMTALGLMVLVSKLNSTTKSTVLLLVVLSLMFFGARGALATFLVAIIIYVAFKDYPNKRNSANPVLKGIYKFGAVGLFCGGVYLLVFNTVIGAPLAERLVYDDSVGARVESLLILERMTIGEYFWGIGMGGIQEATATYLDVDIIENFFVFIILQVGIPAAILLLIPFIKAASFYAKNAGFNGWVLFIGFVVAASTNNSLSIKTPALAVFFLCLYCLFFNRERVFRSTRSCSHSCE